MKVEVEGAGEVVKGAGDVVEGAGYVVDGAIVIVSESSGIFEIVPFQGKDPVPPPRHWHSPRNISQFYWHLKELNCSGLLYSSRCYLLSVICYLMLRE